MSVPFNRIKKLGQGAFGEVWLVNTAQGLAAVKYLVNPNPEHLARFAREARILWQQLDNRYVVDLLDHDLAASPPFFMMEYCEGGNLRAWVDRRRPWRAATAALSHAVQGIAGIHRLGGFHRDVKPENLLVGRSPEGKVQIKVADFGLARVPQTTSPLMTRSAGGTDGYIAPELLTGSDFHASADVYALGVVGIELLTGRRDPAALNILDAPANLKDLLRRMVFPLPEARPTIQQVAAGLAAAHSASASTQPVNAQPMDTQPVARSSSGGIDWKTIGGIAVAALGLLALANSDDKKWDAEVGRFRGADGRFRGG